ncbi:ABC transporter permease [Staphylococcus saprophyticus]|nr:ABC transporter permease [Staphylococcus saprophyticus]
MLLTFLKYENIKFIKSFQFIAPIFLYLIWVVGIYIYTDIPILSSYGSTSVALYIISTWLTITNFKTDSINERYVFYIQLSSKLKYLIFKMTYIFLIVFTLNIISLFYPILLGNFDKSMTLNLFFIGLIIHILMGGFGILLGTYITNTNIIFKPYWWLITVFFIIVSLIKIIIVNKLPFTNWILWILPPINNLLSYLTEDSIQIYDLNFLVLVLISFAYQFIAFCPLIYLYKKKY